MDDLIKTIHDKKTQYFYKNDLNDPTAYFEWEYILIDNKKVKNAWCMPGGKIAIYTGILDITKNIIIALDKMSKKRKSAIQEKVPFPIRKIFESYLLTFGKNGISKIILKTFSEIVFSLI